MKNKLLTCVLAVLTLTLPLLARAEDRQVANNLYLIDSPTANSLLRGTYEAFLRIYSPGGFLGRFMFGFHDRILMGGGVNLDNVIGNGPVQFQTPRFIAKIKILEEWKELPAWAIGYDGIGYGSYDTNTGVWQRKQNGFYTCLTKEFRGTVVLQTTLGLDRVDSLTYDAKRDIVPFIGFAGGITKELVVNLEYADWFRDAGGTLNAGLGYAFDPSLKLEFDFRELTLPGQPAERTLKIDYINYI